MESYNMLAICSLIYSINAASHRRKCVFHALRLCITLNYRACQLRPIVFVAHSLGGIIVKETLRQSETSHQKLNYRSIYESTQATIFLGCPHRGSGNASLALVVANMSRLALQAPNKPLIKSVESRSEILDICGRAFAEYTTHMSHIKVYSFFEEKPMSGVYGFSGRASRLTSRTILLLTNRDHRWSKKLLRLLDSLQNTQQV